jgi:hypothetical protein
MLLIVSSFAFATDFTTDNQAFVSLQGGNVSSFDLYGGVTGAEGVVNGSFEFDGTDDYVRTNLFFAPTFMLFHRITDRYIELGDGQLKKIIHVPFKEVVDHIDFHHFLNFIVFKTIPLFWIPAHTLTFLLPENYRVLMAAYLSVILGFILSITKHKIQKKTI